MIRKSVQRFSDATNAERVLRGDHAQSKSIPPVPDGKRKLNANNGSAGIGFNRP
jgi:hypothetical protein